MIRIHWVLLGAGGVAILIGGLVAGFFLGVASTKMGEDLLESLVSDEQPADVANAVRLDRDGFRLDYPANWRVDKKDEDYDPDHLFTIESPGSAFVMFILGALDSDPGETLKMQREQHEKMMSDASFEPFPTYAGLAGKGATMKGRVLGIPTTIRIFTCNRDGTTVIMTEHCPDEDLKHVRAGFELVEKSFALKAGAESEKPDRPVKNGRNNVEE
jgi:hypothetical protein